VFKEHQNINQLKGRVPREGGGEELKGGGMNEKIGLKQFDTVQQYEC